MAHPRGASADGGRGGAILTLGYRCITAMPEPWRYRGIGL